MSVHTPRPTIPIEVSIERDSISYWVTRGTEQTIKPEDELTFLGDCSTATNVRELQPGNAYTFIDVAPDSVILSDGEDRIMLFKETFSLALRNGYFHIH